MRGKNYRIFGFSQYITYINWAQGSVTIVEMKYMMNPIEGSLKATEEYQNKIAFGISNGIDNFF